MKKTICILFALLLVVAFPAVAMAADGEAAPMPAVGYLIEYGVQIAATLLITLIGVFGAWLTAKLAQKARLENINIATQEVIRAAKLTVGELQQTVVEDLKAASADGKLTESEISHLGKSLITQTLEKLSEPAYALLKAAAVDVEALIVGTAENWINKLKNDAKK